MNKIYMKDKIGYVELLDVFGSEDEIREAAGISHMSKKGPTIEDLLSWNHMSPFEFAEVKFRVKAPIFVIRQWFRHRTGSYMEKSLRYCEGKPEFYIPEGDYSELYKKAYDLAYDNYEFLLALGEEKQTARAMLPLSIYSEFFFKIDMRNFIHFLDMRFDSHAQEEIRDYAEAMLTLIQNSFPIIYNYILTLKAEK